MTNRQNAAEAKNSALNAAQSAQRREDIRLTKMMLTIFLCFLVCFLPLMLVNVADDDVQFPFLHIIASVLAWASAVVNPFIYAFKNRQYQQAFIKVLDLTRKKYLRGTRYKSTTGRACILASLDIIITF